MYMVLNYFGLGVNQGEKSLQKQSEKIKRNIKMIGRSALGREKKSVKKEKMQLECARYVEGEKLRDAVKAREQT